jgi:hypothetical protein
LVRGHMKVEYTATVHTYSTVHGYGYIATVQYMHMARWFNTLPQSAQPNFALLAHSA